MSSIFINQYELSLGQKIIFPVYSVYSYRHLQAAFEAVTWLGRTVHVLTALVQSIPILGAILSIVERRLAIHFQTAKDKKAKENVEHVPEVQEIIPKEVEEITPEEVEEIIEDEPENEPFVEKIVPHNEIPEDLVEEEVVEAEKPAPEIIYNHNENEIKKEIKEELQVLPKIDVEAILNQVKTQQDATHSILSTKGFVGEVGDVLTHYGYKGEVQGSEALRTVTAHVTKLFPQAISPAALRAQKEVNLEQYLTLAIKRFAHVHALKGYAPLPSGKRVNLEGFCEAFTIPMVTSSFQEYAQTSDLFDGEESLWISEQLKQTVSSDYVSPDDIQMMALCIQNPDYVGPTPISSGYDWHDTTAIFFGRYLFYCNQGGLCQFQPGIRIFLLPEREKVTEAVIWEMTKRQEVTAQEHFGVERIQSELGGVEVYYERLPGQTVGNCTYESKKTTLYALMCIRYCLASLEQTSLTEGLVDKNSWQTTFELVRTAFEEWVKFDQNLVFEEFTSEVQEWIENKNMFGQIKLKETFKAALTAYQQKMGLDPVHLAKVNQLLATF